MSHKPKVDYVAIPYVERLIRPKVIGYQGIPIARGEVGDYYCRWCPCVPQEERPFMNGQVLEWIVARETFESAPSRRIKVSKRTFFWEILYAHSFREESKLLTASYGGEIPVCPGDHLFVLGSLGAATFVLRVDHANIIREVIPVHVGAITNMNRS